MAFKVQQKTISLRRPSDWNTRYWPFGWKIEQAREVSKIGSRDDNRHATAIIIAALAR